MKRETSRNIYIKYSLIILLMFILIVLSLFIISWITHKDIDYGPDPHTHVVFLVQQGDGNMSSGCLFELTGGCGPSVKITEHCIKVGKEGRSLITLRWPEDGNSSYSIDFRQRTDDEKWLDAAETIGFDAPLELKDQDIFNGDILIIQLVENETKIVLHQDHIIYRE